MRSRELRLGLSSIGVQLVVSLETDPAQGPPGDEPEAAATELREDKHQGLTDTPGDGEVRIAWSLQRDQAWTHHFDFSLQIPQLQTTYFSKHTDF